ncbi:NifB/NifX family molybdenum-iron cluster-binding protein [Marinospirillum perlucidum]|uniref:NifB/NifX family molybdenum-iron cluster-binding protein n=1 Tax=Marinospirillum perlucidum TaxID=1982602 RepID=UPI000DF42BBB|nr:NifB/NifX family molybdenum-iron cluster-binding protein [Marinospirillum perlucidum]
MSSISKVAAQRLSHAARVLSEDDPANFILALGSHLGLPITEDKLKTLTVEDMNRILSGEDGLLPENYQHASMQLALRHLWGDESGQQPPPEVEEEPAELKGKAGLLVAVASNQEQQLDGHFGSCLRFLIYKVSKEGVYLKEVREASHLDRGSERNALRAELLKDCQLLYVQSIGGPAAAKVVRAGVHPVKFPLPGPARDALAQLQGHLDNPPPWLARVLGVDSSVSLRFTGEVEE